VAELPKHTVVALDIIDIELLWERNDQISEDEVAACAQNSFENEATPAQRRDRYSLAHQAARLTTKTRK